MSPEKLGQHFLSENWQDQIEDEIRLDDGIWIEIGAGHGEMTTRLAQKASKVFAIELDQRLIGSLRNATARSKKVEIVQKDVLSIDFEKLAGDAKFSVYGNLPYYITSPILHRLFEHADRIQAIHVLIQYEVAVRIVAEPGRRDYGYLSVASHWFGQPELILKIPPGAFNPPPKVDSALVSFYMPGQRATYPEIAENENAFLDFIKECFAQKRKMLRNNLRARLGKNTEEVIHQAGLPAEVRAETLSIAQFANLFKLAHQ